MEGASIDDIVREMAKMPSKKDTDRLVIITQVSNFSDVYMETELFLLVQTGVQL